MVVTEMDRRDARIYYKGGIDRQTIHPNTESALIFLNKNYGTQISDSKNGDFERWGLKKSESIIKKGGDLYSLMFKKMQDEMHNRIGY